MLLAFTWRKMLLEGKKVKGKGGKEDVGGIGTMQLSTD